MSIDLHFSQNDWTRIERDWGAWWARDLDRPMVMIETSHQMVSANQELTPEFLFEKPVQEIVDYFQAKLEDKRFYGDAWPRWFPNYGPGYLAAFLGARVTCMPEQRTVWFDSEECKDIDELAFEYSPDNPYWLRVKQLTQAAVERWGDMVSVGHTDLGGNLDILSSFRTANRLLLELCDCPERVAELSEQITRVWLRYYDELYQIIGQACRGSSGWAEIWSPGKTYMTQCDFSYMISPKMFEEFVMPDLSACFDRLDHSFYHLDGKGQIVHLDLLLSMDNLDGIQWIPGAGQPQPEQWMSLLKRIRDGGKLCQVYVTAHGARQIVKQIGGRGFALYVVPFPVMSEDEAKSYLKTLAEEDISLGK